MKLTVGHVIGTALKAYGVPYITGLPGHGNWNLLDAFNDAGSDVPVVQVMHEQAAVHIADAHYRVTCRKSGTFSRSSSCITPWPRMWVLALPDSSSRPVESQ